MLATDERNLNKIDMWEEKLIGDYLEKNNVFYPKERNWTKHDVAAAMEYAIEKERQRITDLLNSDMSCGVAEITGTWIEMHLPK